MAVGTAGDATSVSFSSQQPSSLVQNDGEDPIITWGIGGSEVGGSHKEEEEEEEEVNPKKWCALNDEEPTT